MPQDFHETWFDALCIGEGEIALAELCRRIEQHVPRENMFEDLPSFLAKEVHGSCPQDPIPLSDCIEQLDSLPTMDRNLFDMNKILPSRSGWIDVFTARGCPYACTYCCNHVYSRLYRKSKGRPIGHRQRDVAHVIDEIRDLQNQYGSAVKVISFQEDFLNYDRNWMFKFCSCYQKEIGLPFYMNARAESIDAGLATALKKANCWEVGIGIESGSHLIRNQILGKHLLDQSIFSTCRVLKSVGIRVFANIMLGSPHETRQTLAQTIEMLAATKLDIVRPATTVPLPGTDLYRYCQKQGILRKNESDITSLFNESILSFENLSSLLIESQLSPTIDLLMEDIMNVLDTT